MIWVVHPGSRIPDPDADFLPSRIPDPGSRGQNGTQSRIPDPGSGSATLLPELKQRNITAGYVHYSKLPSVAFAENVSLFVTFLGTNQNKGKGNISVHNCFSFRSQKNKSTEICLFSSSPRIIS